MRKIGQVVDFQNKICSPNKYKSVNVWFSEKSL